METIRSVVLIVKLPPGQLWQRLVASQAVSLHGTAMATRLFEKQNIGISLDELVWIGATWETWTPETASSSSERGTFQCSRAATVLQEGKSMADFKEASTEY